MLPITPVENFADIVYSYVVDPSLPVQTTVSASSNIVNTTLVYANLLTTGNFLKNVNKSYAGKGDTLIYSLFVQNTGNVTANNVIITDVLPNNIAYVPNTLTIDGVLSPDIPNTGINLTSIPSGASSVISFSALVNDIPSVNPMMNIATIAYSYIVDPSLQNSISAQGPSNPVYTTITYADLYSNGNFSKAASLTQANIFNTLTYSFIVRNTGNTTAYNTVVYDTLPLALSFVPGSLFVNGIPSPDTPNTGIALPDIGPSQAIPITFDVTIDTLPTLNPIINRGTIIYNYTEDPNQPLSVVVTTLSNPTPTQVQPLVTFTKSTPTEYVLVGDTISYNLSIANLNNVALSNVSVRDILPPELSFVKGSITVNTVTVPNANVLTGVTLSSLPPNSLTTVGFKVRLLDTTLTTIPNQATLKYTYPGTGSTSLLAQVTSNTSLLNVVKNSVLVTKTASVATITNYESILYTVTVTNTGELQLYDMLFKDIFPNQANLIPGSFQVNGVVVNLGVVTMEKGVDTGPLDVGATTTITFEVYPKNCCSYNQTYNIVNSSYFTYTYVLPDGTGGQAISSIATCTVVKS